MSVHPLATHTLPDGHTVQLDWTLRHDQRSLAHKVSVKLDTDKPLRNRLWSKSVMLDQGVYKCDICKQFGACTGYSAAHMLLSTPKTMSAIGDVASHTIYHEAKKRDQWAGEGYEGSSVLGAMQYLKDVGVLSAYYWATTLREMQVAVSNYGPLVIGVDWFRDMFYPDADGFINPTGRPAGGHAIQVIGNSVRDEAFILPNTWGPKYGKNGTCKIKWTDMDQLIALRGEFALPRKVRGGLLALP